MLLLHIMEATRLLLNRRKGAAHIEVVLVVVVVLLEDGDGASRN